MNNCKNCGKEIPQGIDYCRDCAEKHSKGNSEKSFAKACPESAKIIEQEKQNVKSYMEDLRDGGFQKGCKYREAKLKAIFQARQEGLLDEKILRELRLGGLTTQKARELMKDSEELLGR